MRVYYKVSIYLLDNQLGPIRLQVQTKFYAAFNFNTVTVQF